MTGFCDKTVNRDDKNVLTSWSMGIIIIRAFCRVQCLSIPSVRPDIMAVRRSARVREFSLEEEHVRRSKNFNFGLVLQFGTSLTDGLTRAFSFFC